MKKLYRLHPEVDFQVYRPEMEWLAENIRSGTPFTMTKINHVYWEYLRGSPRPVEKLDTLFGHEFLAELQQDLKHLPTNNFLFGASHFGNPGVHYCENPKLTVECIKSSLPEGYVPYLGTYWKESYISGAIQPFLDALKTRKVVIVGMDHLRSAGSNFVRLYADTAQRREEVLAMLRDQHEPEAVYLIQAGDILATWFLVRLHDLGGTWIDLGRVLDRWSENRDWSADDLAIQPKLEWGYPNMRNQPWEKRIDKAVENRYGRRYF